MSTTAEQLRDALTEVSAAREEAARARNALHDAEVREHLATARMRNLHTRLVAEALGSRYDATMICYSLKLPE